MGTYSGMARAAALVAVLALAVASTAAAHQWHAGGYTALASESDTSTQYEPPRKQVESGIAAENVACREWHVLAIRVSENAPICVAPDTAEALSERGIVSRIIGYTEKYAQESGAAGAQEAGAESGGAAGAQEAGAESGGAAGSSDSKVPDSDDTGGADDTHNTGPEASATATVTQQYGATHRGDISAVPASTMSIVNFYVTDDDLNVSPGSPDIVPTAGLLRFTVNGIPIEGPATMTETGPSTGQFYVRLELPAMIDGRPLNQDDVVSVTYLDQTDASGEHRTSTKSFALSSTYAQVYAEGSGGKRIGHEFTLRIYEPDANTDSREEDRIPMSRFEFKSEGGIRATLDHGAFDANRSHMIETGPNTGVFEVTIKIPRQIDGEVIHIGDWYEIIYHDHTTPSGTSEEIVLRGKIGLRG